MENSTNYTDYRIEIVPTGLIGTPWQSDTIFGHLVWLIAQQEGNKAARDFIKPFMENDPPFVLSDGFPGDCLPVPLFHHELVTAENRSLEEHEMVKKNKKAVYIIYDGFQKARRDGKIRNGLVDYPLISVETLHASLSRNTNTTTENGGLFTTYESYLKNDESINVYARCLPNWADKLLNLFEQLSQIGYGRDKSTGIGAFQIESFKIFDGFNGFDGANGFVSLSSFVPAENDPVDGHWRIRVKRGFLGELAGNGNPFKRPLIQFEPGAVFKNETALKPWYGRIVRNIAPGMPEAVQNCMTLAVPCKISV